MKCLIVTDLHYSDLEIGALELRHASTPQKLKTALSELTDGCEFIACLGDVADGLEGHMPQKQALGEVCDLFASCPLPVYTTFGNHDTKMPKEAFMQMTGMPGRYYAFETADCLCLMLDSCMNDKAIPYPLEEIWWMDCYIDDEQLVWLERQLSQAQKPVVVFTHIMLSNGGTSEEKHILNNSDEVCQILLAHEDKIAAVFCGHYHWGMNLRIGSIPYVTLHSFCMGEEISCATVEIKDGCVALTGHGRQPSVRYER